MACVGHQSIHSLHRVHLSSSVKGVTGVFAPRVAETAMERLGKIRGKQVPAILIVVYGNRDYEDALIELRDYACEAGFIPVAAAAFIT